MGNENSLACHDRDHGRPGYPGFISKGQLASPLRLSFRLPCVRWSERHLGLQAGELNRPVRAASYDCYIDFSPHFTDRSKVRHITRFVFLLRVSLRLERYFRARWPASRSPESREARGDWLSGIFFR